jgi:hypothetical protein
MDGRTAAHGIRGCAHANQHLRVSGAVELEKGLTAAGSIGLEGSPVMEGEHLVQSPQQAAYAASRQQRPALDIPSVRPLRFGPGAVDLAQAVAEHPNGYRLGADGQAYAGPGQTGDASDRWQCTEGSDPPGLLPPGCTGGRPVSAPSGWSSAPDPDAIPARHWRFSGNTAADGIYFVEGWIEVDSHAGAPTAPWAVTLIALNSIRISGAPSLQAFTGDGALRNLLLVSGNDIELSGDGHNRYAGAIFAHQQVRAGGAFRLDGFVVAEHGRTTWSGDPAPDCDAGVDLQCGGDGHSLVSGAIEIHYDGLSTAGFADGVRLLSWTEIRN